MKASIRWYAVIGIMISGIDSIIVMLDSMLVRQGMEMSLRCFLKKGKCVEGIAVGPISTNTIKGSFQGNIQSDIFTNCFTTF